MSLSHGGFLVIDAQVSLKGTSAIRSSWASKRLSVRTVIHMGFGVYPGPTLTRTQPEESQNFGASVASEHIGKDKG